MQVSCGSVKSSLRARGNIEERSESVSVGFGVLLISEHAHINPAMFSRCMCLGSAPTPDELVVMSVVSFCVRQHLSISTWLTWAETGWPSGPGWSSNPIYTGRFSSEPRTSRDSSGSGRCCSCSTPGSPENNIHLLCFSEREREGENERET